jgi:XTP/dITP diphosphohydrolase
LSGAETRQGEGVRALVEVMDRLRSPGGCPWDARQTHASLVPYALEEAYEVAEAIESGDRAGVREELGDLLLQVVFHARIAQDDELEPFDLDDVARGVTEKLVRRHPHVFDVDGATNRSATDRSATDRSATDRSATDRSVTDLEGLHAQWDRIKAVEKQRESVLDGIPAAQGALARGQKVLARARRAGREAGVDLAQVAAPDLPGGADAAGGVAWTEAEMGRRLLELVAVADQLGIDAESALRTTVRAVEADVRAQEQGDRGPKVRGWGPL